VIHADEPRTVVPAHGETVADVRSRAVLDLRGDLVRLRALRLDELDALWADRIADGAFPHLSRPGARERLRLQVERSGRIIGGRLDLGIEAGGELVGHIEARGGVGVGRGGIFELGISLFPPERRRGYGTEAICLLTAHLLDGAGAGRVQASTAVGNAGMRRILEALGFSSERLLREFMPDSNGEREDYVLYAVTRASWKLSPWLGWNS